MGLNNLTYRATGVPSHAWWNDFFDALTDDVYARNSSGIVTGYRNLGSLVYPWENLYLNGSVFVNGNEIDLSVTTENPNRISTGATRTDSSQPLYLTPTGSSNSCTIEAGTTPLEFFVNGTKYTLSSNIVITSLSTAPATNNTCLVNNTDLAAAEQTKFAGEYNSDLLTVDTFGSEVTSRIGNITAFTVGTSEIFIGYLTATEIRNAYRGFFFDNADAPIVRETISNNDTITLLKLGWVFLQSNLTTTDVTYDTPMVGADTPTLNYAGGALVGGEYWYDLINQEWKRYDFGTTTWISVNRTLLGYVVMDDTNCIAARALDFTKEFSNQNTISLEKLSDEEIIASQFNNLISVYGTNIRYASDRPKWNITTDLETGSESSSTRYYLYIKESGDTVISLERPYFRIDLKGWYHPYQTWRMASIFGGIYNDSSSDLVDSFGDRTAENGEHTIRFTTTGQYFIPPLGVEYCDGQVISGGGGGADAGSGAGGGGGGASAVCYFLNKDFYTIHLLTIGLGGAGGLPAGGGLPGSPGTASQFGIFASPGFGAGGIGSTGGAGSSSGTKYTTIGSGESGYNGSGANGGWGGGFNAGAPGTGGASDGSDGISPGTGGGGASGAQTGGRGADGIIIVKLSNVFYL